MGQSRHGEGRVDVGRNTVQMPMQMQMQMQMQRQRQSVQGVGDELARLGEKKVWSNREMDYGEEV